MAVWAAASVTLTVNAAVPAAVGVPDSTPPPLSVTPLGRAPEFTVQTSGPVPPVAVNAGLLYAAPTSPGTGVASARVGAALMITAEVFTDSVPAPAALTALTVNV